MFMNNLALAGGLLYMFSYGPVDNLSVDRFLQRQRGAMPIDDTSAPDENTDTEVTEVIIVAETSEAPVPTDRV